MKKSAINWLFNYLLIILCSSTSIIVYALNVKCVLNPYYIPVCGSDNKTYGNKDLLNCHNKYRQRHKQVTIVAHRECAPLICPSYHDLQGPWQSSVPVCTNNGYTYGDVHQVRCLKEFIPNIEILHEGGCTLFEVRKALGRNARRKACAEPRRTFETNAICTVRNETHQNPFRALCEHPRGLREKVGGICGCPFQRSCDKAHDIQQSLRSAPIDERTKFVVCGSDWRTYRSHYHLECTRRFNKYLYTMHEGRCRRMEDPCPEKLKYTKTPSPVCGSDKRSYVSYDSLICAKYRISKGLKYIHAGSCIRPT